MRHGVLIAIVKIACVPQTAPNLEITFDPSIFVEGEHSLIHEGMYAWEEFGFIVGADDTQSECSWTWPQDFDPGAPCAIRMRAQKLDGPSLARAHFRGSIIEFDEALTGYPLFAYARHEIGHIVMHTLDHVPLGESGVMSSERLRSTFTDADRDLICDKIEICK